MTGTNSPVPRMPLHLVLFHCLSVIIFILPEKIAPGSLGVFVLSSVGSPCDSDALWGNSQSNLVLQCFPIGRPASLASRDLRSSESKVKDKRHLCANFKGLIGRIMNAHWEVNAQEWDAFDWLCSDVKLWAHKVGHFGASDRAAESSLTVPSTFCDSWQNNRGLIRDKYLIPKRMSETFANLKK